MHHVCNSETPTVCLCVCLLTEDEMPGVSSRLSRVSEQLERLPCSVPTIPGGYPLRHDGRQDVRCGQMVSLYIFLVTNGDID